MFLQVSKRTAYNKEEATATLSRQGIVGGSRRSRKLNRLSSSINKSKRNHKKYSLTKEIVSKRINKKSKLRGGKKSRKYKFSHKNINKF